MFWTNAKECITANQLSIFMFLMKQLGSQCWGCPNGSKTSKKQKRPLTDAFVLSLGDVSGWQKCNHRHRGTPESSPPFFDKGIVMEHEVEVEGRLEISNIWSDMEQHDDEKNV